MVIGMLRYNLRPSSFVDCVFNCWLCRGLVIFNVDSDLCCRLGRYYWLVLQSRVIFVTCAAYVGHCAAISVHFTKLSDTLATCVWHFNKREHLWGQLCATIIKYHTSEAQLCYELIKYQARGAQCVVNLVKYHTNRAPICVSFNKITFSGALLDVHILLK